MKKIILAVLVLVTGISKIKPQGCSDAGVCTIHSIKNNTETMSDDNENNDLIFGFGFGKGERFISYYTPYIEYTRSITDRTSITGKIGFSWISGELANTNGLSDLFLSINHSFDIKSKWQKSFIVGIKLPFDKADIVKNDIHLPMPYQTSLGTTDLVLGLNFIRKSFGATVAVQQPLGPVNDNRFLPGDYPSNTVAQEYPSTNKFSRSGDILLRLSYNFNIKEKFSIRPSLLGIYHETNDSYLDMNKVRKDIPNSNGLTLNANLFLDYKINKTSGVELSIGTPFVVREERPDGLTRSFATTLEYRFSF